MIKLVLFDKIMNFLALNHNSMGER